MSESSHYVTSDYYDPGFFDETMLFVTGIAVVLVLFVVAVVGSRYLLLSSRRLSSRQRKLLRFFSGLSRPTKVESRFARTGSLGGRKKDEEHYRLKAADPIEAGDRSQAPRAAPMRRRNAVPLRTATGKLAPLPEEAWPVYAQEEIEAVAEVLRSGKVNQWTGRKVFEFEAAYTRELRNGRAIAVANGSVALELALRAYGIGPGDEVIVTPRSFVASAFCVRLVGATPVFADVDRQSGAITAETIAAKVTPRTKAIIPVHLAGWPADMPAIMKAADRHGHLVIEDCAQAHGAEIDGLPVGSFAQVACFSFCQDKIISTGGEGGLVTFRDEQAFERAWSFKDHGKDRGRTLEPATEPGFRWLHDSVGTNWRMTEISATIGLLQLAKLPNWRMRRNAHAAVWAEALSRVPGLRVPQVPLNYTNAFYKFYAYVDAEPAHARQIRDLILQAGAAAGIRIFSGSCSEIYREAAFRDLAVEPLPVARELGESSLMFEVHPTLDGGLLRERAEATADIAGKIIG